MMLLQRSRRSAHRSPASALWLAAGAVLVAATLAPALTGAEAQTRRRKPITHTVVMEGTSFEPAALTVTLGDSIEWVNRDFFPHTATASDAFDSGIVPAGKSWTHTPAEKGEASYACTLHPTMKGTLRVK